MNKYYQKSQKQAGLLGAIGGSLLIALSVMPAKIALAMPQMERDQLISQVSPNPTNSDEAPSGTFTTPLNPRPSIFNEPPYNRSQPTPSAAPNSAPTVEPIPDTSTPATTPPTNQPTPSSTVQPPLPEDRQPPSAMVVPTNGMVSIRLVNETGADINYQVIGDTNQRSLQGKSNVMLQDLPVPVTVTFKRQDGGLLKVIPQASSEPEMLEVTFTETTDLSTDKSTMVIQKDGGVFLN